mmetsp:Transcript_51611/g.109754  ORF Transcript_51611/g.109754 Transcript_51611/m.109754 type:complete len:209 (+) Transcript_51611:315-941(+)|eukprot:CAMPEP_0172525930 /NCGR_PEP_ID=MMETSP1067-20121228/935_1 /TAXON_ID=265564 ORGANISM="Thalassiosira punctigera, Strain Tpunct2005C2" /NCGR_SAMPLE_ID=MMETSP1067 /ASSEMBLY_ACC=CAM_ASM_000444 /LENGTH=208 /DNA_ID=CAMNT_0013309321 /DNA_START=276 /DNA_END=902 /DNA_ORIENTATION=-
MKFTAFITSLLFLGSAAFAPGAGNARSSTALSAEKGATSRIEFLQRSAALAASLTLLPGQANAAKYGGFGAGSPEVIDPKDAIVDSDILKSDSVQSAIKSVRGYKQSVLDMKSSLASDNQADIGPKIRKDFDFSIVRTDLNSINAALDEDTQRGTDRIVRAILQDITELEVTQKQKPGVARSETRLGNVIRKLDKLEKSFDDYLAFAN